MCTLLTAPVTGPQGEYEARAVTIHLAALTLTHGRTHTDTDRHTLRHTRTHTLMHEPADARVRVYRDDPQTGADHIRPLWYVA